MKWSEATKSEKNKFLWGIIIQAVITLIFVVALMLISNHIAGHK